MILPGYYRENLSEDGEEYVLTHGDRAVYLRSETFEAEQPQLEWPQQSDEDYREDSRFKSDLYWVILLSAELAQGQATLWAWQGLYQTLWGTATVTALSRHADDRAWAETILRTVKPDIDTLGVITCLDL